MTVTLSLDCITVRHAVRFARLRNGQFNIRRGKDNLFKGVALHVFDILDITEL